MGWKELLCLVQLVSRCYQFSSATERRATILFIEFENGHMMHGYTLPSTNE